MPTLCHFHIHIPRKRERRHTMPNGEPAIQVFRECSCGRRSTYIETRAVQPTEDFGRNPMRKKRRLKHLPKNYKRSRWERHIEKSFRERADS
jgi:hypothetical protein